MLGAITDDELTEALDEIDWAIDRAGLTDDATFSWMAGRVGVELVRLRETVAAAVVEARGLAELLDARRRLTIALHPRLHPSAEWHPE